MHFWFYLFIAIIYHPKIKGRKYLSDNMLFFKILYHEKSGHTRKKYSVFVLVFSRLPNIQQHCIEPGEQFLAHGKIPEGKNGFSFYHKKTITQGKIPGDRGY